MTAVLAAERISVSFGAVRACADVSIHVGADEIVGLVGPNGSGKSTFLNAVTGVVPATGEVTVGGRIVRMGHPLHVRRAGVVRAFQTPQNFAALSCLDNVCLADLDHTGTSVLRAVFGRRSTMRHERRRWAGACAALDRVGLAGMAETGAGQLTYGQLRLLELARSIAGDPAVLLLDEPSAGLNAAETRHLAGVLAGLRDDGVPMLVVDHKVDFLDRICRRLVVLQAGAVIAEGEPAAVWSDQAVVDAYLGVAADG